MLFLRSWLEEYISLKSFTDKQIADLITLKSSEVEEILNHNDYFNAKVLIGQIKNVRSHPNADKLKIFDVNIGNNQSVQIVSAAPNVSEGLIVPVALDGARLPYVVIRERQLRGELSQGMCCGKSELLLENGTSEGLWELNQIIPLSNYTPENVLGQPIDTIFPDLFPYETIFDIKILPNRISEIGHHAGMALDIAALIGDESLLTQKGRYLRNPEQLKPHLNHLLEKVKHNEHEIEIIDKVHYSKTFFLFRITNKNPYLLPSLYQKRMFLTSRNLVGGFADLTNYFAADFGHPTHVFSPKVHNYDKDAQTFIIDKTVTPITFNGLGQLKNTVLPSGTPILYDKSQPEEILALPGISGAESTKSKPEEEETVLEIADFNFEEVGRACFRLKYRSDGSRLYIGGVNVHLILVTLWNYLEHFENETDITFLAGLFGENQSSTTSWENVVSWLNSLFESSEKVFIDYEYISRRLDEKGEDYWRPKIDHVLNLKGKIVDNYFIPNVFFSNILTRSDVYEEVLRLVSYENLAISKTITSSLNSFNHDRRIDSIHSLKQLVSSFNFQEIITRPFVNQNMVLQTIDPFIEVLKPYSTLFPYLRNTLLYTLINSLSENALRGEKDGKIFEINQIFERTEERIKSREVLSVAGFGENPYQFTTLIFALGERFGVSWNPEPLDDTNPYNQLGRGYEYSSKENNSVNITFLEISSEVKKEYNIPLHKHVWVLESAIPSDLQPFHYKQYTDESQFPSVFRAYSLFIEDKVRWSDIHNQIISSYQKQWKNLEPDYTLTIYPKERFEKDEGEVLNFEIVFKSDTRTLSGEEIQAFEARFIKELNTVGKVMFR